MSIKFGKTSKQVDRNTKKVTIVHEYMKVKSNDELIEGNITKMDRNPNSNKR